MIDPYVALETLEGPEKISYWFRKGKAHYYMILQLMVWLKTGSSIDVISQAISELYAKERSHRLNIVQKC